MVTPVTFSTSPSMLTSTVRPVREAHLRTTATTARSPSRVPNWASSQPASIPSPLAPSGAASAVSGATEASSTPSSSACSSPARSASSSTSLSAVGSTCKISLATSATTPPPPTVQILTLCHHQPRSPREFDGGIRIRSEHKPAGSQRPESHTSLPGMPRPARPNRQRATGVTFDTRAARRPARHTPSTR